MEIFGIGGWELVALLVLMLVVAGPKRMIQWSYVLGRELAKLRRMWGEASKILQKEIDAAGIDYQVPTEPPTRAGLRSEAIKLLAPITKPMQQAMNDVEAEFSAETSAVKQAAAQVNNLKFSTQNPTAAPKPAAQAAPKPAFKPVNGGSPMSTAGASSNGAPSSPVGTSNGSAGGINLGSWSGGAASAPPAGSPTPGQPGLGTWSAGQSNPPKPNDDPAQA